MHIGIIVTTSASRIAVIGLSRAAAERGHHVSLFLTDSAVRLCLDPEVASLGRLPEVEGTFCSFSARQWDIDESKVPDALEAGSQYAHALIQDRADRVISL